MTQARAPAHALTRTHARTHALSSARARARTAPHNTYTTSAHRLGRTHTSTHTLHRRSRAHTWTRTQTQPQPQSLGAAATAARRARTKRSDSLPSSHTHLHQVCLAHPYRHTPDDASESQCHTHLLSRTPFMNHTHLNRARLARLRTSNASGWTRLVADLGYLAATRAQRPCVRRSESPIVRVAGLPSRRDPPVPPGSAQTPHSDTHTHTRRTP